MTIYIIKRVLAVIPVLVIISFLTVAMLRLAPGDPAATLAGDTATPPQIQAIRHDLRLDRSIPVQYALFMRDIFHGDLGRSLKNNRTVTAELRTRMPYTAQTDGGGDGLRDCRRCRYRHRLRDAPELDSG